FGAQYGLTYLDFYQNGLVVPIVSVDCQFKKPLRYGDRVIVEARYVDAPAAKIQFEYRLLHAQSGDLVATGNSTQVFLNKDDMTLLWSMPDFFSAWKKRWLNDT
ncbi:MAG: acyl-CoA thioesterase, partial [Thermoanaerobaculia bacterium]|nr:acyl-CoA thioesterase [Thermoanaerobaculia bacterium]